jgi:hypothetical protein
MKKLLWTALIASTSAAAAALTGRLVRYAWTRIAGEPPPEPPVWARWLVGKPLGAGVASLTR